MLAWVAEVLLWAPLESTGGRGEVGGALILAGLACAVVTIRLRDDAEG